jgi:long-chain acyl-CoA synthetase
MSMVELLLRQARRAPQSPAIYEGERLLMNYGQWAQAAAGLAQRLRDHGLCPGERVALFMRNHPRYLVALWGVWWAGGVVVPINAKLHPKEAQWIVDDAQASVALVSGDVCGVTLSGVAHQVDVDSPTADGWFVTADGAPPVPVSPRQLSELAWLFYTSGTTGRPKGVMITHRNLMTMGLSYFVDVDAVGATDAMVYAAPMSHGAGLYAVPHVMAGARHVVPASGGVDAAELLALARALGPLSTFAAPTIVNRLVEEALSQGLTAAQCAQSFKTIVYGGAPMYVADIRRALAVMGERFVQIYGQGETPMVATALSRAVLGDKDHPAYESRLASIGVAQTAVQVRVTNAQGQDLPLGEVGEVVVKGDSVMAGYWRNPAATAAAIQDGWLFTGDMGAMDAHGYVTLKDRSKDLIISGGSNIYPREIEEVLLEVDGVSEVAVVGEPDAVWGENVVAFVVAPAEVSDAALDAYCLGHIARFKRPKRYVRMGALPKNNYGKVLKTVLRESLTRPSASPERGD